MSPGLTDRRLNARRRGRCCAAGRRSLRACCQGRDGRCAPRRRLIDAVTTYTCTVRFANGTPVATEHGEGCLAATGYGPADFAADPSLWFTMVHPEDRSRVRRHVQQRVISALELQRTLTQVLRVGLEPVPVQELLQRTLTLLCSMRRLAIQPKGAIFLVKEDPDLLVLEAHRGLPPAETEADRFVTLFLGLLDPQARSLAYASAGHAPGHLLDGANAARARLTSTGWPLGMFERASHDPRPTVALSPGDLLLLLTDGVLEAGPVGGDCFGKERALDVVRAHRTRPAGEIVRRLYDAVREFTAPATLDDDVTVVVIKVH